MELDKTDIDNLTKAVELKPRQGTGLFGMAKRRTERMQDKPMAARRGGFLRQQRRDSEGEEAHNHQNDRRDSQPSANQYGQNRTENRTDNRNERSDNRFNKARSGGNSYNNDRADNRGNSFNSNRSENRYGNQQNRNRSEGRYNPNERLDRSDRQERSEQPEKKKPFVVTKGFKKF